MAFSNSLHLKFNHSAFDGFSALIKTVTQLLLLISMDSDVIALSPGNPWDMKLEYSEPHKVLPWDNHK
jgi:hypothetical protein